MHAKLNVNWLLFLLLGLFLTTDLAAQDIILDQPIRAGELTLFPSLRNKNEYYYLSDKPRIGLNENGKPQFSFLRYVENQRSGADQPDLNEGTGGGIVHAVIELGISEEQLSAAKQILQRLNPNGKIRGATMYQGGTIALISTVVDSESGFSERKVLGLGKAPILDGQKAAISIQLTKLGAKVLWQSFETPTPDMSISFEMELRGYNSPKSAVIEANFDQIYTHNSFQAGMISRQGNVMLAAEIDAAYDDLYKSGAIKVTQIGKDEDMEKALDDAYKKLTKMMFEQEKGNPMAVGQAQIPGQDQSKGILDRAESILKQGREDAKEDYEMMKEAEQIEALLSGGGNEYQTGVSPTGTQTETSKPTPKSQPRPHSTDRKPSKAFLNLPEHLRPSPRSQEIDPPKLPKTAIVAAFKMRESRQRGVFKIDLNKYTIENLTIRFDENFGQSVSRSACSECFQEVNLDDPLFKQREIAAVLDGFNAQDFGNYINYVSISLEKKHQGGDYTFDDVRIDRNKFNQAGNNTKLMYGWKEDSNRIKWREYRYKMVWNFFGGYTTETDWMVSTGNTIPLAPPVYIKSIDVEVDPEIMNQENVRSVEVKLYYQLGEKEQMKQIRMNMRAGQMTSQIDLLQPFNSIQYDYEVSWHLSDGSTRQSTRKSSSSLIIYADNI